MSAIQISRKEACCGCAACAVICPRACIAMARDAEGFDYPRVDVARCVQCGKCVAVCPVSRPPDSSLQAARPAARIIQFRSDAVRALSSSGGAFTALAEAALARGAVVYGAAFAPEFSAVRHRAARTRDEIAALRGSKYVQSDTEPSFREIARDVAGGQPVLFVGTPCQVAGLRNLVGERAQGLVTCDLVCHGVPSPGVFAAYMAEQHRRFGAGTTAYNFRDKAQGWNCWSVRHSFANGRVCARWNWGDPFMHGFLRDAFLRPACHDCHFVGLPRFADLTLGDYWGVSTRFPASDDNRGTSLVLVNTAAGEELLRAASARLLDLPGDLDHAIAHNPFIVRPPAVPPWRRLFFERFVRTGSVTDASRTYVRAGFLLKRRCARTVKQAIWMIRGLLRPRLHPEVVRPGSP